MFEPDTTARVCLNLEGATSRDARRSARHMHDRWERTALNYRVAQKHIDACFTVMCAVVIEYSLMQFVCANGGCNLCDMPRRWRARF